MALTRFGVPLRQTGVGAALEKLIHG
jgi:hypothetical protein